MAIETGRRVGDPPGQPACRGLPSGTARRALRGRCCSPPPRWRSRRIGPSQESHRCGIGHRPCRRAWRWNRHPHPHRERPCPRPRCCTPPGGDLHGRRGSPRWRHPRIVKHPPLLVGLVAVHTGGDLVGFLLPEPSLDDLDVDLLDAGVALGAGGSHVVPVDAGTRIGVGEDVVGRVTGGAHRRHGQPRPVQPVPVDGHGVVLEDPGPVGCRGFWKRDSPPGGTPRRGRGCSWWMWGSPGFGWRGRCDPRDSPRTTAPASPPGPRPGHGGTGRVVDPGWSGRKRSSPGGHPPQCGGEGRSGGRGCSRPRRYHAPMIPIVRESPGVGSPVPYPAAWQDPRGT